MNLFVREFGPVGAPAIIFLHGGTMSGWSWEPVVQRMQGYHCLVPDLTGFGKSFEQGPFEMDRAADAVAEVIRSRVGSGRAHWWACRSALTSWSAAGGDRARNSSIVRCCAEPSSTRCPVYV